MSFRVVGLGHRSRETPVPGCSRETEFLWPNPPSPTRNRDINDLLERQYATITRLEDLIKRLVDRSHTVIAGRLQLVYIHSW